jgi:hypothetical protein
VVILEWVVAKVVKVWKLRQKYGHKWNHNKKFSLQSFEAFFKSGIWKQILQQLQQDQSGIRSQAPEMSMSENVNMAEQMPGGGIADVDVREKVAMAANGGLMGLYNRGM